MYDSNRAGLYESREVERSQLRQLASLITPREANSCMANASQIRVTLKGEEGRLMD